MSDFLNEGGYGFYVWSAYGISALALALLVIWTVAGWHKAKSRLAAIAARDEEVP